MKRIKYLRINLLKEAKDMYLENYKMPVKEIKDDTYTLYVWWWYTLFLDWKSQ